MVGAGRLKAVNALLAKGADPLRRDNQGVLFLDRTVETALGGVQRVRPEVLESLRAVLRRSPVGSMRPWRCADRRTWNSISWR